MDTIALHRLIEYHLFYVRIESFDCTREVKSMANIKSAIKRAKLSEERRAHNASIKSDMRSAVKTVEAFSY